MQFQKKEELFLGYLARTPKYQHWYPVFYIMANTGMRVGEITGLRWCDVDMENGIISVNHTLVYYNHRDEKGCYFSINTPKTKAGMVLKNYIGGMAVVAMSGRPAQRQDQAARIARFAVTPESLRVSMTLRV